MVIMFPIQKQICFKIQFYSMLQAVNTGKHWNTLTVSKKELFFLPTFTPASCSFSLGGEGVGQREREKKLRGRNRE